MEVLRNRRFGGSVGVFVPYAPQHIGQGGREGGRGEGYGGPSGTAAWCLHTWVKACGTGRARLNECADREQRPGVGVVPCAGVPVLGGLPGHPRTGRHRIPHGVHPRDGGQHRAGGRERVLGCGEGPVAPDEAPDGAAVGDTHPMAPAALCLVVLTLDQEHPALRSAGPGLRRGGSGAADGEGTQVPKGRQHGGDLGGLHALPPKEAGGPPERSRRAVPQAKGLRERGTRHCQALGNALQGRQPPSGCAPVAVQWRKHPMRMSSRLRRRGNGPSRAWSTQLTPAEGSLRARVVGGAARSLHG